MGAVLHFFVNVFVISAAIVPFLIAAALIVYRTRQTRERLVRGLALFTATLIALGIQAMGLSVGSAVVSSLSAGGFVGFVAKLLWVAVGGGAGVLLGRYLITQLSGSTDRQIRIMVFVGMVAHVELLLIYIDSFSRNGFAVLPGAIPDIAFIVGLALYIVLKYDATEVNKIRAGMPHRGVTTGGAGLDEDDRKVPLIAEEKYIDIFGEHF